MVEEIYNTWIKIQFQKPGIHRYPAAATEDNLKDVSYLGNEHFHYFFFYVTLDVYHDDRDIEFHQFRKWCESLYSENQLNVDYKSCEMLAKDLIVEIKQRYPNRRIKVEVYEDNINGALVEYNGTITYQ